MILSRSRFLLGSLVLFAAACATLADAETGGENLPNAAAGPFRALRSDEVGLLRAAPNVLVDDRSLPRDPAILDADDDPSTLETLGYFAIAPKVGNEDPDPTAAPNTIVRYIAPDGRSFDRSPVTVLTAELPWEGGFIGAPAVLRIGGEVFLYYTAAGGIGLARSTDGTSFTREGAAVLAPDPNGWEAGRVPANPAVIQLEDGSLLMFYDVAGEAIAEARSSDGVSWQRIGSGPVLAPRADVNPDDPFYDGKAVAEPSAVLARSSEGRPILRVYYAATDALGRRSIALAARYDPAAGALDRALTPVFVGSLAPRQPCVVVRPGYSMLFVTQTAGSGKSQQYPAVAAALAPVNAVLAPPAR